MQIKKFEQMDETVYYEKLDNGLQVYLMPKAGFNKTYATFTTKYGSIDNHFVPLSKDEPIVVPDGIAHFLEHKLFEKEDYDVFEKFTENGASSNAYTSFTRTCYLFSTTSKVEENLTILLDYVQEPYFTEATVEKEKGIIEEEIKMFDDNVDFKAYFGVLNNMYAKHPIKIDIAGTVESIYQITADDLHICYETFYHPSNMILFVVGDIDPETLIETIRSNQDAKGYTDALEIKRFFPEEPAHVAVAEAERKMQVSTPKMFVGVKGTVDTKLPAKALLKVDLALELLLEMLFGSSSDYYEQILHDELANESFGFESMREQAISFCFIGGDTSKPDELATSIKEKLLSVAGLSLNEDEFLRIKRKKIGQFLSALNSVEFIANRFTEYAFNGLTLFDVVELLEELQIADVRTVAQDYFKADRLTVFKIIPE